MRAVLLDYLACPDCGGDLGLSADRSDGDEVLEGTLTCAGCSTRYGVRAGVPRMNVRMDDLAGIAASFGFEWKAHHAGRFEDETLWGRTRNEDWRFFLSCMGATDEQIAGSTVLDAGCGSARFTQLAGEHGARVAIGVDINEAVDEAFTACRHLDNVHIVQGNILDLPLKRKIFEYVWCSGVLHHTPDAAAAHRSLSRHVKPGGTLYVWVYAKRFNPFRFTKTLFDAMRITRLPPQSLLRVSRAIAYISFGLLWAYQRARRLPGLRPTTVWGRRTVRPRRLDELQLTWFDALSPEYDSRHTETEVFSWFQAQEFEDIEAIDEPKVGVRGRAPMDDTANQSSA